MTTTPDILYPKYATDEEKIAHLLDFTDDPYERRRLLVDLYGCRVASLMVIYADAFAEARPEYPEKGKENECR